MLTKRIALALYFSLALTPTTHAAATLPEPSLTRALKEKNVQELAGFALHHLVADGIFVYRGIEGLYASLMPDRYFDNNAEKFGVIGKVTGEMKDEIDGILQEIGLNPQKVRLLAINPERANVLLGEDTYMPAIAMGSALLIDPKFFNFLPQEERRAIVGHEAMHIKNRDLLKASLVSLAIPVITYFGVNKYNELSKKGFDAAMGALNLQDAGLGSIVHTVFGWHQYLLGSAPSKLLISGSIFAWYQRMREKIADIGSVRTLQCAEDAVQTLEHFRDMQLEAKENFADINPLLDLLIDENGENVLDTIHPRLAERIAYLREIALEQE